MRVATAASDFRLADLRRRRMAIYLSIDPADTGAYGRLFRVFFEMAADTLMRPDGSTAPVSGPESDSAHEVLLLIDEFATFGRLPLIEKLMAAVRGYRARIMIVCQALSQLDDIYGMAGRNALLGNATRHIFMPNPDPATGAYVSQRIGDTTMVARTQSRSSGVDHGRTSTSMAQAVRTFLKPEEFERLQTGSAVLLAPGAPPFRLRVRGWFERDLFRKRGIAAPSISSLGNEPPVSPFRARRPVRRNNARRAGNGAPKTEVSAQGDMLKAASARESAARSEPVPPRAQDDRIKTEPSTPAQIIEDAENINARP